MLQKTRKRQSHPDR